MTKPPHLLAVAIAFLALPLASVARAEPPHAGSNELRLEQATYLVPGIGLSGLSHESLSNNGSSASQTMFGIGVAYGRFLTDNVEIGSSVSLLYVGSSSTSSTSLTGLGLSPFIRFFTMVDPHVGLFGGLAGGFQTFSPSRGNGVTMWSGGVDAGAELFIVDSWSFRVGPTYRYLHESTGNSSTTGHAYGASWALVGYF
jgi:hypothetical protein